MTLTEDELDAIVNRADLPNDDRLLINLPSAQEDIRILLAIIHELRDEIGVLKAPI